MRPRVRLTGRRLTVTPVVSDSSMRALLDWRPDWKTQAVGAILASRPGVLVDVGANVGQTLLDFLSAPKGSTYVGFEPNLTCCQHLAQLISANRLENCQVIPSALGERSGISTLYRFGGDTDPGASTLRELRPALPAQPSTISMFRFDDLSDALPSDEISLIKIDVEGGELQVLRGMEATLRRRRGWILCEVLHRDRHADADDYQRRCSELMRFLEDLGYSVLRIIIGTSGSSVDGLEAVSSFPQVVYEEESVRACEYLFVPSAEAADARKLLGQ